MKGQVDVSVDVLGQVFLRGSVASEQVAREIIEACAERAGCHPSGQPVVGRPAARRQRGSLTTAAPTTDDRSGGTQSRTAQARGTGG